MYLESSKEWNTYEDELGAKPIKHTLIFLSLHSSKGPACFSFKRSARHSEGGYCTKEQSK